MKSTKQSLFTSLVCLLLCVSMLIGTTFAWFTDIATSTGNKIQSGSLKVDLEILDEVSGKWHSLKKENKPIFNYDLWEPGYTDLTILKVENEGRLALKWVAKFESEDELSILTDVIDVYVCPSKTELSYTDDRSLEGYTYVGNLTKFINTIEETTYGTLEAKECAYLGIALKMQETAGNEYQGLSIGGSFDIRILATQWTGESDSFDDQYDKDATYPSIVDKLKLTADITGKVDADGRLTEEVKLYDRYSGVLATLPIGTRVADGADKLTLHIAEDSVYGKITLDMRVGYDVSVEGISTNNDVPVIVYMPKVLPAEQTGIQLYHAGNQMDRVYTLEALSEREGNNDAYGDKFIYDSATGDVTFSVTHFSNISLASTKSVLVKGEEKEGIEINLNNYEGDLLQNGSLVIPADGNTYILVWDSGDMSKKNALDLTLTHTWHNLNPGTYSETPIKVEKGATVVLHGVNIRTNSSVDAIELINPADTTNGIGKTCIYVADGTQNWLTGKSGIGFGANNPNYAADIYVEGNGNLYTTAMGWGSPGIGVDSYSDGNQSNMHFSVGFLRSIPMNAAAGIGGGFANTSWFCLNLMEFNGGTYHVYRGGDAASIGTGTNGDCGEIIIHNRATVHCYTNPWTAYGRDMGHGMYAGTCAGIYVSEDSYVLGWSHKNGSYGDWQPGHGYVPNGNRVQDAAVIVNDFETASINIVSSKVVAGVLTEVKAEVNGEVVDLDASKCRLDGNNVIVTAVMAGGEITYLKSPTASMAVKAEVNTVITVDNITPSGYKYQYFVGDEFTRDGLKLTITYSDGSTTEIDTGFEVTGFDSTTAGDKTLTVTYKGKTNTFIVNVKTIAPENAVITTSPTKTNYFVGESLDLSGLVITVTNNNGSTYTVESDFNASGFNTNAAGIQTITVTVADNIAVTFTVTVKAIEPAEIEITKAPDKTEYYVGDTLDLGGMVITITNNNGSVYTVTGGYLADVTELTTAGQQKVTITVDGLSADIYVTVKAVELVEIEIVKPTKTEYFVGDALDRAGMKVTAVYNNGDRVEISASDCTISGDTANAGTQTITVTYEGKTATFTIIVKEVVLDKIEVTAPTNTEYFEGEALDRAGMKVTAVYNNGDRVEITEGYALDNEIATQVGVQTITVTYEGKTATFTITVTAVIPTGITVTPPTKSNYFVGETLDFTGFKVVVTFNNGNTETFESANGEKPEGITVSGYTNLIAGDKEITVSYTKNNETVSGSFTVTVVPNVNFLYRVGNQNEVTKAQIATMLTGADHNGSNVTIEKNIGNAEYNGSKFTGTGLVKVTIDGTVYYLEVVNAKNTTTGNIRNSGLLNGTDFVLLCDVEYTEGQTITMNGSTIYGNGFKYDFSKFVPQDSDKNNIFVIEMNAATFDNVKLIGKVFDTAYVYQDDAKSEGEIEKYQSLIVANDGSRILNSYVSGTRSPIRVQGVVEITNSTISGGSVANIDVKGGTLNLNNVTTINQGTDVVGYGIFIDNDGGDKYNATINVDGLTSYNWLTSDDVNHMYDPTEGNYMDDILNSILESKGATSVNFSLVCLNINEGIKINGIDVETAKISDHDGRLYSDDITAGKEVPEYEYGEYAPTTPKFVIQNLDTVKPSVTPHAYLNDGKVSVGINTGSAYSLNLKDILAITGGVAPSISDIKVDGTTISGDSYTFGAADKYTVEYTVIDSGEYTLDGKVVETEQRTFIYSIIVEVSIAEIKDAVMTSTYNNAKEVYMQIPASTSSDFTVDVPLLQGLTIEDNGQTVLSQGQVTLPSGWSIGNVTKLADQDYEVVITTNIKNQNNVNTTLRIRVQYLPNTSATVEEVTFQNVSTLVMHGTAKKAKVDTSKSDWANGPHIYYYYTGYNGKEVKIEDLYCKYNKDLTPRETGSSGNSGNTNPCVTPDTLITLADGSQIRVDALTGNEMLLVWNHTTGKFDIAPVGYIVDHNGDIGEYNITHLYFSNGYEIKTVGEHVFFDNTLNKYVAITPENAEKYIGHSFAVMSGDTLTTVELVKVEQYVEETAVYEVVSYEHITCFTNNILSASAFLDKLLNIFEIDPETMSYNAEEVQKDIETYGLYTYADFEGLIAEEAFELYNAKYLKIAVGKGYITWDDILALIDIYFDVDVQPIQ